MASRRDNQSIIILYQFNSRASKAMEPQVRCFFFLLHEPDREFGYFFFSRSVEHDSIRSQYLNVHHIIYSSFF